MRTRGRKQCSYTLSLTEASISFGCKGAIYSWDVWKTRETVLPLLPCDTAKYSEDSHWLPFSRRNVNYLVPGQLTFTCHGRLKPYLLNLEFFQPFLAQINARPKFTSYALATFTSIAGLILFATGTTELQLQIQSWYNIFFLFLSIGRQ